MSPEQIGKYVVASLLGRGAMGEVYLAEDPYIGRRVAIKVVKGADPAARERFLQEARVVGGLSHPAIVALLDFDFTGDEPFLVMEYLKGQSLEAWMLETHTLSERLVVLEDLCGALAYAHANGVLHRDVKASNVQVLPNGRAKLMDFGIARADAAKLTATGTVMGTPNYMAPEILKDAAYSSRSDLYACGVVLYEMFAGKNPFAASTVAACLSNVLYLDPPHLRELSTYVPGQLADAVMASMRKSPESRPDGFGGLLTAARMAREGASADVAPALETQAIPRQGPRQTAARPASRRSRAALVAVLIGAVAAVWWVMRPERLLQSREPMPSPVASASIVPKPPPARPSERPIPEPSASAHSPELVPARPSSAARTAPDSMPTPDPSDRSREIPPAPAVQTERRPATPTPPVATPTPFALAAPENPTAATPAAILSRVSPRNVRRGASIPLELRGSGFRPELRVVALHGRRPAAGIRVVRQELMDSGAIRITLLVDPDVPLGEYTLSLRDGKGDMTNGMTIEVVL